MGERQVDGVEASRVAVGQGFMLATPLQLAHAVSIIASRGKSFRPRLVAATRNPATGKLTPIPAQLAENINVTSPENWQVAIDGMLAVTEGGTASRAAAGASYRIAGKTGTAQVFSIAQNAKYDEKQLDQRMRDHAWFIAFAPAENPKIAVAVMVENRGSSHVAAPIARKIMDAYLLRKFPTDAEAAAAMLAPGNASIDVSGAAETERQE